MSDDSIPIELDLPSDSDNGLPAWVATLIVAIGAIIPIPADAAFAALRTLLAPYAAGGAQRATFEALSTSARQAIRAAYDAKYTAINRPAGSRGGVGERQAIPVVREASGPVLAQGSTPTPTPTPTSAPVVAQQRVTPRNGTWAKLRTGPSRGQWGARIPSGRDYVRVGDIVRLYRSGNRGASLHVLTDIVHADATTTIAAVRDVTDAERASVIGSTPPNGVPAAVADSNAALTERLATAGLVDDPAGMAALLNAYDAARGLRTPEPDMRTPQAGEYTEAEAQRDFPPSAPVAAQATCPTCGDAPIEVDGYCAAHVSPRVGAGAAVETSLADIAAEATANAQPSAPRAERETVAPTTTVGWSAADSGEHATTARTHIPTGPSVFDAPRSQRQPFQVQPTQTRSQVRGLLAERDFIAGAVAEGSMLQVSWTGGGETTCGKIDDALAAIGREDDAPERKSALAYAGDAVDSLKNRMYDTYRMPNAQLPDGVKAMWCVGRKLSGRTINAGDAYGEALLVVSLKDDDTLAFDGDVALGNAIRARYAAATAKQTLKSDTLTAWLGRTLRTRHAAVKRGHVWYVPGGQADAARKLIDAISPLWGDHEHIPVTTGPDLFRSLVRGLTVEAQAIADDLSEQTKAAKLRAREKAEKEARKRFGATDATVTAAMDLAERRAMVSGTVAARLLRTLGSVAARVQGYETMLGSEAVETTKRLVADLRKTLEPLTDDTSARAAMLELD